MPTVPKFQTLFRPIIFLTLVLLILVPFLSLARQAAKHYVGSSQIALIQPSPPAPNSGYQQGQTQELRVRNLLRNEGFDEPLGNTDAAIRENLGLKTNQGKIADFVGSNSSNDRWLVAESKGGDLRAAVRQLDNTAQHLWERNIGANPTNTEFRIYTNSVQFNKLLVSVNESKMGGYVIQNSYLGYTDEVGTWIYETINGSRIVVILAP